MILFGDDSPPRSHRSRPGQAEDAHRTRQQASRHDPVSSLPWARGRGNAARRDAGGGQAEGRHAGNCLRDVLTQGRKGDAVMAKIELSGAFEADAQGDLHHGRVTVYFEPEFHGRPLLTLHFKGATDGAGEVTEHAMHVKGASEIDALRRYCEMVLAQNCPPAIPARSIESLGLTRHCIYSLQRESITTADALLALSAVDLRKLPGFGPKMLGVIEGRLALRGLALRQPQG